MFRISPGLLTKEFDIIDLFQNSLPKYKDWGNSSKTFSSLQSLQICSVWCIFMMNVGLLIYEPVKNRS